MPVLNVTRGTLLAKRLLTPGSFFSDAACDLNRDGIPKECALWITPCNSVHTVGMKRPVDIVFIDSEGCVIKILKNFPPNCVAESDCDAVGALELPADRLDESGTDAGDVLVLDGDLSTIS